MLGIDALCIVQDDPEDMKKELKAMCNVYKGALLTITVDVADSASEGFLGQRDWTGPNQISVPYTNESLACTGTIEIRRPLMPRSSCRALDSRGWTLQENILSPRTLHISSQQLFWSCQSQYCSEGNPKQDETEVAGHDEGTIKFSFLLPGSNILPTSSSTIELRVDTMLRKWYVLVGDYTRRSLSYTGDIFPAIAALAEEIALQTEYDYKGGLWEQDTHQWLLWSANQNAIIPENYRAPSWSWASLDLRAAGGIYSPTNKPH